MALQYRTTFIFEFSKQGFTEVWYRQAADPKSATQFAVTDLTQFLGLRPKGTTLQAIRSNDVTQPRLGFLSVLNLTINTLNPAGAADGDIPQAAILLSLRARTGQRRPYMMRCVDDDWIQYDDIGDPVFSASLNKALGYWFGALQRMGLMFRYLLPADPPAGPNPDRVVTSLGPNGTDLTRTVINYTGTAIPTPTRVIFHKLSRTQFPGLQGTVPVFAGAASQVVAPVNWQQPVGTAPGGPATIRQALYSYTGIDEYYPEDFRSKKVGGTLLRARGRRPALHYRSR